MLHGASEVIGRRNSVLARIEFQIRDEFQFLPHGFAFRHFASWPQHFCFTTTPFLPCNVSVVLKVKILRSVGTLPNSHRWILSASTRHAFSSLRRNPVGTEFVQIPHPQHDTGE